MAGEPAGWTEEPVPEAAPVGWTEEPATESAAQWTEEPVPSTPAPGDVPAFGFTAEDISNEVKQAEAETQAEYDARLRKAFRDAQDQGGDDPAATARVATTLGLPFDQVRTNLKAFRATAAEAEFDPARWRKENPELARAIERNPDLGRLVLRSKDTPVLVQLFRKASDYLHDSLGIMSDADIAEQEQLARMFNESPDDAMRFAEGIDQRARVRTELERTARDKPQKQLEVEDTQAAGVQAMAKTGNTEGPRSAGQVGASAVAYAARVLWERGGEARKRLELSGLQMRVMLAENGITTKDDPRDVADLQAELADARAAMVPRAYGDDTGALRNLSAGVEGAVSTVVGLKEGAKGAGVVGTVGATVAGGAALVATRNPAVAGEAALFGARVGGQKGFQAGFLVSTFQMETASSYEALRESETDKGERLTPAEAMGGALVQGAIKTGFEYVSFGAATKGLKGALPETITGLIRRDPTFRALLRQLATEYGKSSLVEGGTEMLQDLVEQIGDYVQLSLHDQALQKGPVVRPERTLEAGQAGLVGALMTGAAMNSVAALTTRIDEGRTELADKQIAPLLALAQDENVQAAPAELAKVVADISLEQGHKPLASIHVDPAAIFTYFQQQGLNDDQAEAMLDEATGRKGSVEEAAAAAANGTKLEVPVQAVLSTWGRSEIGQALAQDTTTDPNGITQRQRQQQKQELDARTKAVLEQEQAKLEDAEHVAQMVEQYAQSIVESGRSATEARKASALLRTFIETALAEAPGRRAAEVFPDLPLQFHVGDEYRTTQQELEPGLLEPSTEAEKAAVLTPGAEVSPESAAAALTEEQRAQKLYVDEISGLNTRRAWDETPRTPGTQVGVLTLPPIKAINDSPRGAHDVSNRLLRTVGGLLGKLVRPGRLAVRSGTDFLVETDGQAEMEALAAQIQQQLPQGLEVLGFSGPNVEAVYGTEKSVTKARRELPAEHPQHLPARGKTRFDTESLSFESFPGAAAEGRQVPAGVKPLSLERFTSEALYDRQMPGVYSKLGFDLAPRRKFTASIDMRGLKLINELAEKLGLGKTLGDEVLRQFSEAAKRVGGGLLYFAHLSGDEFAAKSNNRDELEAFVEAFQAELQRVSVPVTLKSGKKVNLTPAFRHGIGSTYGLADQDLNTRKAAEQSASPQGSPDADLRAVGILRDGSGVDRPAGADAADPALARGAEEAGRDSRANGAAPEGDAGNRRRGDGGAPAAEVTTPKFPGFAEERARLQAKQRELESLAADDAPQAFPLKGGGKVVVARDPSKPGAWRATFIDGETDEPTGHMEAPDKLGALEAARGSGAIIEGVSADAAPEPGSDIGEENVEPLTAEEQALEAAITRRLEGREARAEEEALMRAGFNTDEDIALAREALARFRAVVEKTDKPESAERAARRRKAAERVRDERKRLAEAWLKWIEGSGPPLVETGTAYAPKGAIKVEAERLKDIVAWGRKLGLLDPQSGFSAFIEEQNRLQGIKPIRVRRKKGVFRGVGTTEDLRAAFVKNVLGRLAQADTQTALATIGAFQDEILSALPEGTADSFAPDSNRRMTHAEETWAEARVAIAHARWALRDLARAARAGTPASAAQRSLFAARNALEVAGQSEHVTRLMLQGKGRQEALDALWESPAPERLAIAKASKAFGPMLQDIEDRLNGKEGRRVLFQLPTEEESRARLQEHLVLLDALREAGAQAVATPAQWASLIASFEFHLRTRWRLREGGEQAVADALRDAISTTFGRYLKSGDSTSGATRAKKAGLTPDLRRELLRHGKAYLSSGLRMGDAQGLPMHGLRQSEQVARELSGELQLDRPEGRSGGSRTYGAPLSNLRELWDGGRVREGSLYPADVYGPQGRRIYGDPGTPGDAETWRIIAAVKGRPDAEVEVWTTREPTESQQIEPGDLVTLSREHAASRIIDERGEQLVSAKVRAGDLFADGNFMLEWGYDPKMPEGKAPARTRSLKARDVKPGMYVAGRDGAFRKVLAVDRPEPGLYEMDLEGGGTREAWGEVLVAAEGEKPPTPPAQRQLGKRWYQDDTASQPGAPKWYSQVERTVAAARQAKNTGAAWWALLSKSPGVKKEELALMGVEDFLRGRSSVTKDELLKFAQDNAVVLKEVTREPISQRAIDDIASFSAGLADAIERARTALLEGNGDTLEEEPRRLAYRALDSLADALNEVSPLEDESLSVLAGGSRNGYGAMWLNLDSSLQGARNALDDLRTGLAPLPPDLPLRLRRDPELSPELLWVDEARAQVRDAKRALESIEAATRDQGERPDVTSFNEYVVGGESAPAEVKASYREITFQHPGAEGWSNPHFEGPVIAHARTTLRRLESGKRALMVEEVQSDLHQAGRTGGYRGEVSEDDAFARQFERGDAQRPPRAPWSTTWEELVAKRMVTLALENGLTDIAWTTGLEQADRYAEEDTVRWNRIKGGMIAAYDERLPRVFERILAPWKLKAREGRLSTGETVWHVDISGAAMDVISRGGMPLFQENEGDAPAAAPAPKGPRGYTKVDPNRKLRSTIDVFLNRHANFSTVVHESAHAFLEMLLDQAEAPEASDRAKAKGKMALEALGVTDRAEITDKHHERFARAYEGWLFEGKQVARGVQRAFRAFSSWLTRIYRSLRSIPDFDPADLERLRPVFDAMHATERELAAARRAQGPRTALTEEQRLEEEDDYAEATYATQLRAMKDALRVHEQWWKTALQKLRVTFREEYEDLPARRAQRILSGEGTRGDGVVLNEAQVRAVIGDARVVGMRTSETGVAPSVVAEQAGFRNATEMLGALAALPTRDRWVEQQATAAMEQAHPGLSQRIEEFRKAIQGGLHKATERRLLREWAGIPAQAIQQAAAQQALNRTIDPRRLRPAAALAAMRRAAAEKARAAAAGDIKTAGDAARIEMMNHYLHRELLKAEEERERMLALAKRLAREDSRGKAGRADPAYRDGIDFVLGAFGLADARPDVGADDLQQAVAQLNGDAVVVGDPDWLAPVLQALGRVDRWEDLNVGEMRAVSDALKMLDAGARARRTVLLEDGRHDYETIRDEMLKEIGSTLASQGPVIPKNVRNAAERLWSLANEADAFLTNPIDLVRDLTGDKPDTWLHRVFVNNMRRAQSLETQLLEDVISPILKSLEEMPKKVRKRLAEPVDGRALFPEHRKDLEPPRRRWELLALALNLGNESSREVTLRGRSITLEQATAALQDLTAEEISWINTVHQALEKLREPSFALEERETGLAPEAVTAVPLKLANGELTGGYFPLKAEPGVSRVSRLQAAEDALASLLDPSYTRPVTRHGHLKARTGAVYAVTFDLDVIRRHLLQSAHDIAFREAVKTAGRFVMDEKVQAALTEYLGAEKAPVFLKWLKDIGGGTGYQATIADRLLSHLKGNLAGAALSGLSTALGNFANLAAAITSTPLTARSLAKGIARWRPSRVGEVSELSGVFRTMQSSALRRLNEELHAAEGLRSPKLAWLREASFAALRGVDAIVSTSVWDGAHKQALEQGMDEAAAVRWADDLLLRVQPSQSIVEKAGILRDKGWAGSLATFYSYLSVAYRAQHRLLAPVFERAFRNASPAQRAVILGKMAGRLLAFYVAFQVLGELGMGRGADDGDRDKDDPENKLKQWRNWFIRKTLGAPLSLIPLVPASSMFDSAVLGKPTMSTRNDPVTGATLQLAKAGTTLWSAANGEAEPEKATREAFRAVGLLTGAPERLISTTGGYAVDLATGAKEPRGALRTTSGLLYGERDNQPENFLTLTDDIIEALLSDW